jgi:hypothetical protein
LFRCSFVADRDLLSELISSRVAMLNIDINAMGGVRNAYRVLATKLEGERLLDGYASKAIP